MKRTMLGLLALAAYGLAASAFAGDQQEIVVGVLPEPGVLALLGVGIVAVVAVRLRGRK